MSEALYRATEAVREDDLSNMVLAREELPLELQDFQVSKDGVLDNETMAEHGFPGSTTGGIRATGRILGYHREFVNPSQESAFQIGSNLIAATVVHLFRDREAVSGWMTKKFIGEFQSFVGHEAGPGQHLISADRLEIEGFSDEAVGMRTLQATPTGPVSSTIVDFRVGRLLGVAYLVSLGDVEREQLTRQMGSELERRIVKVLLGAI